MRSFRRVTLSLLKLHENNNLLVSSLLFFLVVCSPHAKLRFIVLYYQRVKHRLTFKSLCISSHPVPPCFPTSTSHGQSQIRGRVPSH